MLTLLFLLYWCVVPPLSAAATLGLAVWAARQCRLHNAALAAERAAAGAAVVSQGGAR